MTHIRFVQGYIEIDYERVAAILPGKDERIIEGEILGYQDEYETGKEDGFEDGYEEGETTGRESGKEDAQQEFLDTVAELVQKKQVSQKSYNAILRAIE